MTKTFLAGLVVAIEPNARGGAFIHIELDAETKPAVQFAAGRDQAGVVSKLPRTARVQLVRVVWSRLKKERLQDEILLRRVWLDQQPLRFAFVEPNEMPKLGAEGWWYDEQVWRDLL